MLYLGMMSGTSCDGVDVVAVDFNQGIKVIESSFSPYSDSIKSQLLACMNDKAISAMKLNQIDTELGLIYGHVINQFLVDKGIGKKEILAIGMHGQTVYHQPPSQAVPIGNTMQIGSAAITAQITQITTIADFRSMDMAFGGHGAPLAPALHQHVFGRPNRHVVVLNLGGIANITSITGDEVIGFDTGPANCLMDEWIKVHQGLEYDQSGQWAAQGTVDSDLLNYLMSESYFSDAYPKSTGRELFNSNWLRAYPHLDDVKAVDVQRTLLQLTVETINLGLQLLSKPIDRIVVCGGGSNNSFLLKELDRRTAKTCQHSGTYGIAPDDVEAVLMAWLAKQNIENKKLDLTQITGASQPLIYGVRYRL